MAVLQKIRNRGVLLVTIIAVALFLFVIGDLLRGGEGLVNQARQNVGEVAGEKITITEYQSLLEDFQVYSEIMQQKSSFTEDENNQIKDMTWQTLVQNKLIEKECAKLGLTVSDEEVATIIRTGMSQLLQIPYFMNQQGRYDYTLVQGFLSEYNTLKESGQQIPDIYAKLYKYYLFAQRQVRAQQLVGKYQVLLAQCITGNNVAAQANYDARTKESEVLLVSVPLSAVGDEVVQVSDKEIEARYKQDKEHYRQYIETREAKIIDVQVVPSDSDKRAQEQEMVAAYASLAGAADATAAGNVTRQSNSLLHYSNVLKGIDAFPDMIANLLEGDSTSAGTSVGETVKPAYDAMTNCYYTFRLIDKGTEPDSVLYRQIGVVAKDEDEADTRADSIMLALSAGADFKELASLYGQKGDSSWVATAHYQNASLDEDNASFISTIFSTGAGETKRLKLSNGNTVILQILETRNPVTKYNVAAVVKELQFSDDTYSNEYNKFSSFIASNPTLDLIEANAAKEGYSVRPLSAMPATAHQINGIHNTRDAVKWLFDEAKVGDISPLYECGDNDRLLLVALTDVNKVGYASVDKVKDVIRAELIGEKKSDQLLGQCQGVKSVAEARKLKGAVVDTVTRITFAAPAFVRATVSSEPVLSAVASKTAKGDFVGPVKGKGGIYMLQVLGKKEQAEPFDPKAEKNTIAQTQMRTALQTVFNELYLNADVKDQRYKFF